MCLGSKSISSYAYGTALFRSVIWFPRSYFAPHSSAGTRTTTGPKRLLVGFVQTRETPIAKATELQSVVVELEKRIEYVFRQWIPHIVGVQGGADGEPFGEIRFNQVVAQPLVLSNSCHLQGYWQTKSLWAVSKRLLFWWTCPCCRWRIPCLPIWSRDDIFYRLRDLSSPGLMFGSIISSVNVFLNLSTMCCMSDVPLVTFNRLVSMSEVLTVIMSWAYMSRFGSSHKVQLIRHRKSSLISSSTGAGPRASKTLINPTFQTAVSWNRSGYDKRYVSWNYNGSGSSGTRLRPSCWTL